MSHRVIFLGSRPIGYRCLKHLLDHQEAYNITVTGVLTNNTSQLGEADLGALAQVHGVPVLSGLKALLEQSCDYLISVQYHKILRRQHLAVAQKMPINLHMAPLPEYRGSNQFAFALIDGRTTFGTTLHLMDEGIDSGAILAERRFPIPPHCFIKELYDRTVAASFELFETEIGPILAGERPPIDQATLIPERGTATYYRKDIETIKKIDFDWPAEKIERHLRATSMPGFPPPYAEINGVKVSLVVDQNQT